MTIEISATAQASNTGAKPGARAQNAQGAGDASAVSFLSLLGAMGLGAVNATEAATAMPVASAADAQYLVDVRLGADPGHDDDASQAGLAQIPLATDWWAATAATDLDAPDAATDPALAAAAAGLPGRVRAGVQGPGDGTTAAPARARAMAAAQQPAAEAALSKPAAHLNATSELQQLPAHALTAQQEADATPVSSRDFMSRLEAARMATEPDTAALRGSSTPVGGASPLGQVVAMFDAAAAGLHAGGALRSQERFQPRLGGTGTAQGLVTWGDATPAGTQHGASAVYTPGALTPAPATAMAEKVHYWVARGVQSATLQLDAFAGGAVDVSIAVKGDEAIIEFRTDQPQARQLLLEAMPQLKELLASEGLMLAGGFVGDSARQGGQSQGRGTPQTEAREALVGAPQAGAGRAGVPGGVSGSRVDLFV